MTSGAPQVVIVQERLPHYRVPFFELLRTQLATDGVELRLVHGQGHGAMATRGDESQLPWAEVVGNRVVRAGGASLVWQPVLRETSDADLVVVEQASRMAVNYALLARQVLGGPRVAFWGHGANLQSDESWISRRSEGAKRRYSTKPHWWFAYTEGSARRVRALGFPANRITVVQNAVDTRQIATVVADRDPHRAIFVGSLFPAKRLDLIFQTCDLVAEQIPDFSLAIVGDGELRDWVRNAAARRSYATYVGPKTGRELGVELKQSSLMLMPGHVGLGVLEAFACGVPVVTASGMLHSPEFEYLRDGINASVCSGSPESLRSRMVTLLRDKAGLSALRAGCAQASSEYTLDAMVARFASGVLRAVEPGKPSLIEPMVAR